MDLERKFILFTTSFLVLSALMLGFLSYFFLIKGFEGIELAHALRDVERFDRLFQNKISALDVTVKDWAYWDDTYLFVNDRNSQYLSSNINFDSLANLNLDYLFFADAGGQLILSKQVDYSSQTLIDDSITYSLLVQNSSLLDVLSSAEKNLSGILLVNEEIIFFSLRPIYKSDQTGRLAGFLLMGRVFDDYQITEMEQILLYSLSLQVVSEKAVSHDDPSIPLTGLVIRGNDLADYSSPSLDSDNLGAIGFVSIEPTKILAGRELKDVFGTIIGEVTLSISREIYGFIKRIYLMFVLILILVVVLLFFLIFFLGKKILRDTKNQLNELKHSADDILHGKYHHVSLVKGEKEVRELSASFNSMSKELIDSRKNLEQQKKNLEVEVELKTRELKEKINEIQKTKVALLNMMEDVNRANEELMLLDKTKSEFLNMVSHELKTPLTAIIAHLGVLEELSKNLNPQEMESLEAIKRNSFSLKTLISNILEISRMEAGKFELTQVETDIGRLVKDSLANLNILAKQKGLKLVSNLGEIPKKVFVDDTRITECINNLLTNAIKFTEKGSVTISVSSDENYVYVSVEDTGIGIPDGAKNKLFQKFYQVDASISRRYGGTGLGLSITKRIIEAHGGTISIESMVGKGTTFTFKLPLKPSITDSVAKSIDVTDPFTQVDSRIKMLVNERAKSSLKEGNTHG